MESVFSDILGDSERFRGIVMPVDWIRSSMLSVWAVRRSIWKLQMTAENVTFRIEEKESFTDISSIATSGGGIRLWYCALKSIWLQ